MSYELESPYEKLAHEGDTLAEHVRRILGIMDFLRENYHLDVYVRLGKELALFHDIGKLIKTWSISNKRGHNPKHSFIGAWLIYSGYYKKVPRLKELARELSINYNFNQKNKKLITYLTLKHHSNLSKDIMSLEQHYRYEKEHLEIADELYLNFFRDIDEFVDKMEIKDSKLIKVADTFGLFKIGDILSTYGEPAEVIRNYGLSMKIDNVTYSTFKHFLERTSGKYDEKRGKQQWGVISNRAKIKMIRAPTGFGKTYTSIFNGLHRGSRLYLVLPTITAIKNFTDAIKRNFNEKINSNMIGEYFYYFTPQNLNWREGEIDVGEFIVARYLIRPITITTIDQILLTLMLRPKYFLRRFAFGNSTFVMDEVHLWTPDITSYFVSLYNEYIKKGAKYKLVMMSATFPKWLEKLFKDEIKQPIKVFDFSKEYKSRRRVQYETIKIENATDFAEFIIETKNRNKGKSILVIVNRVDLAIKLFDILSKEIPNTLLIHSRFTYEDRENKEKNIKRTLKAGGILISTQISEVSLDISADILITEIAPLPSIIQRFGRVNRYGRKTYETNAYILYGLRNTHPYSKNEITATLDFLIRYQNCKLKNEEQLINGLEMSEFKEMFLERFRESKEIVSDYINIMRENNFFFNTLDKESKELGRFRENTNILAILGTDKNIELLNKKPKDFNESLIQKNILKRMLVPVPIWLLSDVTEFDEAHNVYVIDPQNYDNIRGLTNKQLSDQMI